MPLRRQKAGQYGRTLVTPTTQPAPQARTLLRGQMQVAETLDVCLGNDIGAVVMLSAAHLLQ
jgi:hypothetical protein